MTASRAVPFQERKSPFRGLLDLATGRYPRFLFGGGTGSSLPVFHFHEVHPDALEPYFRYLAENRYRTVTGDALAAFVRRGVHPGPRSVALTFDDAWSSLWVVAAPLLRRYDLRAMAFVSPGRITSRAAPRPQHGEAFDRALDRTEPMFCSWPELKALHEEGRVDIQAHGGLHVKVAAQAEPTDFLQPHHRMHPHEIPLIEAPDGPRLATREDLGAPLYPLRSRLSDVRRWIDPEGTAACLRRVQAGGGPAFFERPSWREELADILRTTPAGRPESVAERDRAIREDLASAREQLEHELGKRTDGLCFPWAVAGDAATRLAAEVGYVYAFADRLGGYRAVRAGDPPFRLMRLKHAYAFCLPGRGRSWMMGRQRPDAGNGLCLDDPPLPRRAVL